MRDDMDAIQRTLGPLPEAYLNWTELGIVEDEDFEIYHLEWIPAADIPDYEVAPEPLIPGLIPVAICHSQWIWCIDSRAGGRVLLCPDDRYDAWIVAPDVEGWICRSCLEMASELDEVGDDERQAIAKWGELLSETRPNWGRTLLDLAAAEAIEVDGGKPLIREGDVEAWIGRELGPSYVGDKVPFVILDE